MEDYNFVTFFCMNNKLYTTVCHISNQAARIRVKKEIFSFTTIQHLSMDKYTTAALPAHWMYLSICSLAQT
jgi:hypothetical protein